MLRREFLAASAASAASQALPRPTKLPNPSRSTEQFLFGAATAGHQIEGNNTNSDLWFLENIRPSRFPTRSGDACDSYHRYAEDIALLKSAGLDSYRFSLEWSRIEPSFGIFSNAELDHYKSMIESCHRNNINPIVTFNHYSCPQWFSMRGGWATLDSADIFARYCDRAARHLADGIHMAATFNEPQVQRIKHWISGTSSPAALELQETFREAARKASASPEYMSFHLCQDDVLLPNLIHAHELGYEAIKSASSTLPVGVTLAIIDYQASGPGSRLDEVRDYVNGAWLDAAKKNSDFIGVQNYGRDLVGPNGLLPPPKATERNMLGQEYYPQGLGNAVKYVYEKTGKPILVSENGIATRDDQQRIRYIDQALDSLHHAMEAGVPVLGYIHWSLLDNFEWILGYTPTFGLVSVDLETFQRTPKASLAHLGMRARNWSKI